jgi:hypothetical protein
MSKKHLFLIFFVFIINRSWSQQAVPVTDTQPVVINGLNIGYNIKSTEVKKVGDKGDFSRYAIRFYVTNVDNFPKIIHYRPGYPHGEGISARLVQFNILNATGARLTSNVAYIDAGPYSIEVPDDRPNHDPHRDRWMKQVGFFIQPGETRSVDEIVITPLNELPNVQVIFQANMLEGGGYAPPPPPPAQVYQAPPPQAPVYQAPPPPPPGGPSAIYYNGFSKFENRYNHTYINNQTGAPASTPIENGWWSAQWRLEPEPGTNFFRIKNKWTGVFLKFDGGYVSLSPDPQVHGCAWIFEPTNEQNVFRIKNHITGGYLCLKNQQLAVSNDFNDAYSSSWRLEPQP